MRHVQQPVNYRCNRNTNTYTIECPHTCIFWSCLDQLGEEADEEELPSDQWPYHPALPWPPPLESDWLSALPASAEASAEADIRFW